MPSTVPWRLAGVPAFDAQDLAIILKYNTSYFSDTDL